jgi:sulfur carrier protein
MMTIQLNGEPREIPEGLTLTALLEWLGLALDRVAVERNRDIVRRSEWSATPIEAGDRLEVVQMVGGGSDRSAGVDQRDLP